MCSGRGLDPKLTKSTSYIDSAGGPRVPQSQQDFVFNRLETAQNLVQDDEPVISRNLKDGSLAKYRHFVSNSS
jgi:hypothetical protein